MSELSHNNPSATTANSLTSSESLSGISIGAAMTGVVPGIPLSAVFHPKQIFATAERFKGYVRTIHWIFFDFIPRRQIMTKLLIVNFTSKLEMPWKIIAEFCTIKSWFNNFSPILLLGIDRPSFHQSDGPNNFVNKQVGICIKRALSCLRFQ